MYQSNASFEIKLNPNSAVKLDYRILKGRTHWTEFKT